MEQIHASHQRVKKDKLFTILTGPNFRSLNGYGQSRGTNFPTHVSLVVLIQQTGLLKLLCVCPHVEWSVNW